MSQPILDLSKPTQPDIDADDVSDQSSFPDPFTSYHPLQHHSGHARKVSAQSTFSNSLIRGSLLKKQSNSTGTTNVYSNSVLPPTVGTFKSFNESTPDSLTPGGPVKHPLSTSIDLTFEERKPSSMPISTRPLPLLPTNSDDTVSPNVQLATSTQKFDTSTDGGFTPTLTDPNHPDCLPLQESPPSHSLKRDRVGPKLTLNTTLDVNIDGSNSGNSDTIINTASSQQLPFPSVPRRTDGSAPRLSLPPANYRFSLNLVDGYSARMSPSVILRPPPLPLLNLPMLPDAISSTNSRRSKRAGLKSLPALPRHGSIRGTNILEDLDDVGEDEDDGDGVDDDGGPDSTPLEDELDTDQSSSSTPLHRSRTPSESSYETIHESSTSENREGYFGDLTRPPEKRFSRSPFLPPVDMSGIDLSFLDFPPPDNKNKGKAKEVTEDTGRMPIAVTPNGRGGTSASTAFMKMDFETKTDTWAASPVITQGDHLSSPIQTPRPGGHFNFPLPVVTPPSPRPPRRPTMESRLSVLSVNPITQFPGTYNLASKSLIDVHALEKKEKVEQMVKEEEEGAEEERKRRVKAKRMSMRAAATSANATTRMSYEQSDGQLNTSTPIQTSTSNWICDDDSIKASEASSSSSPTAERPRKTNNRISMAPAYETIIPLRRRLSMPTFHATSTSPPPYPDLFSNSQIQGVKLTQIQPRDDEGREKLPAYSNSIYIKAIMPRKLEFTQPGVQAKDRKWKRVLCVLEGTSFKVYKPPGVSVIGGWWENQVGVGDMAVSATTTNPSGSVGGRQIAQGADTGGAGAGVAGGAVRKSKEEVERTREMMMTQSSQLNDASQTQGPSFTASSSPYPSSTRIGGPVIPATKSALNLAVHLLIPSSRGHARTTSDVGQSSNTPSFPKLPRPSLNIPLNGRSTPTGSFSSSRSPSPTFAASSSSSLTTSSSRSHRSTTSSTGSGTSRMVASSYHVAASSSTSKGKKQMDDSDLIPHKHNLIKAYTMQQAESGLGSDYVKRKHVIRVRLEGEQFLLQASDVDSVIEWIEVSLFYLAISLI